MKEFKVKDRGYQYSKLLIFIMIIALMLPSIAQTKFPGTTADEFGYLYQAGRFFGWDWEQLMLYYPYYGSGMGFFWLPLFYFFSSNPAMLYQMIVFFNGVLLGTSFLLSVKIGESFFPDWDKKILLLSAFAIVLYPSNYFYAKLALAETMLYLLFWVIVYLLHKMLREPSCQKGIFLGIISSYMILVHLRTAGLIIALIIFFIYLTVLKRISWKILLSYLSILLLGLLIYKVVKNGYYDSLQFENVSNTTNTNISIIDLVKDFMTDIESSIKGSLGHMFYFLISGGVCFFWGIYYLIRSIFGDKYYFGDRGREIDTKREVFIFLVFAFAINFIAFCFRPYENINRLDVAVYGRYLENFMGPILLCGFYYITNKTKWICRNYYYIITILASLPFVIYAMETAKEMIFAPDSAVALGGFFSFDMNEYSINFSLLKALTIAIFVCCGFYILHIIYLKLFSRFRGVWACFIIVLICSYWGYMGGAAQNQELHNRKELFSVYSEMKDVIEATSADKIVFIQDEPDSRNNVKYLQFLYPSNTIEVKSKSYLLNADLHDTVLVCASNDSLEEQVGQEMDILYDNRLKVYGDN